MYIVHAAEVSEEIEMGQISLSWPSLFVLLLRKTLRSVKNRQIFLSIFYWFTDILKLLACEREIKSEFDLRQVEVRELRRTCSREKETQRRKEKPYVKFKSFSQYVRIASLSSSLFEFANDLPRDNRKKKSLSLSRPCVLSIHPTMKVPKDVPLEKEENVSNMTCSTRCVRGVDVKNKSMHNKRMINILRMSFKHCVNSEWIELICLYYRH